MGWWLGKGSNTAPFGLSSEHLVSRDEGGRAEQSHEKGIKRDLPAGWLLLNSQTQPQKFPFLKIPEQPESRKTVFLVTRQKPVELDRKKPTKSKLSCQDDKAPFPTSSQLYFVSSQQSPDL